jgi:cell division protease FtsH
VFLYFRIVSGFQLISVDGRRATVVVPNNPDLINILATNGVHISVFKGEAAGPGAFLAFLGNLLFPFLAFAGLFFIFRCAQGRLILLHLPWSLDW